MQKAFTGSEVGTFFVEFVFLWDILLMSPISHENVTVYWNVFFLVQYKEVKQNCGIQLQKNCKIFNGNTTGQTEVL